MSKCIHMCHSELKDECRRYKIPPYGKGEDLKERLVEAEIKRTQNTLLQYPIALASPSYSRKSLAELKSEAKSRKLPVSGTKEALIKRLRNADTTEWKSRVQSFPRFAELPVEVQELIWQYSLPGPRVLIPAAKTRGKTKALCFPKFNHTPNPAALTTCHLSRKVALKRYRLVFGSKNVYADLEGGDMLSVGPTNFSGVGGHLWETEDGTDPPPAIVTDLERVTHLLLWSFNFRYHYEARDRHSCTEWRLGHHFKEEVSKFKGLKKILLGCGADRGRRWEDESQAQYYVEHDIMKFEPMSLKGDEAAKIIAVAIKSQFRKLHSEEEFIRGIPEIELVEIRHVPDTPRRKLQEANGEPLEELYYDWEEDHWRG